MAKFIVNLFIKPSSSREAYGKLSGVFGIVFSFILAAIKVVAGLISGSIAIIADAIHDLSDTSSAVITFVGFKLASKPEDKKHPYGHARIEYLSGIFVSIVVIIAGVLILKSSVEKIITPEETSFSLLAISLLVIAILLKLWLVFIYRYIAKAIDSLVIFATSIDSRNDIIVTLFVLVGLLVNKFTGINLDGFLGAVVALFVIYSGVQLVIKTSSPLLGEAPDQKLVEEIRNKVMSYEGVLGVHDLVVHNYGPGKVFASMHIEVNADDDFLESHSLIDEIEQDIKKNLKIEFVAHIDPMNVNCPTVKKVRPLIGTYLSQLDKNLSFHDLRAICTKSGTNIIFEVVIGYDCKLNQDQVLSYMKGHLQELNPAYRVIINFEKSYSSL